MAVSDDDACATDPAPDPADLLSFAQIPKENTVMCAIINLLLCPLSRKRMISTIFYEVVLWSHVLLVMRTYLIYDTELSDAFCMHLEETPHHSTWDFELR